MRIVYLGNYQNQNSDSTEKHIKYAFEQLGHEVIPIEEPGFRAAEVIDVCKDADLFFFHQGNVHDESSTKRIIDVLTNVTCTKAFWFFDKVWQGREQLMDLYLKYCDYGFLTDGMWLRMNPGHKNAHQVMQGIGNEDTSLGTPREEYKCDIAFTGSSYSNWLPYREKFIKFLQENYGDRFKVFDKVFNRDLYDLCASAKIMVAPLDPQDNFYWSSRIYLTLGGGGFMIHPKFEGLEEELKSGKDYVGYDFRRGFPQAMEDLKKQIDKYLKNEKKRKQIQEQGRKTVLENYTYLDRIKKILSIINESK